jgi:DNA-binding transcriptional regulator YiaG
MSPLLETTTNRSLTNQAQGMSTVEDRLPTNLSYSIGSAIFTSDRSDTMPTEISKRHILAALNMTTSGVEIRLTIQKTVLSAIIASEDNNYLKHDTFDWQSMRDSITRDKDRGSTISQQTAKNVFLWQNPNPIRKGFELSSTWLMGKISKKRQTPAFYANSIEFDQDVNEIESAALPVKFTQQTVNELRMLSGLTWEQLAILFTVSRRSVHFWASGQPLTSANEEKLNRILDVVKYVSYGSASYNRSLLMSIADEGKSYLDLLTAGEYDRVKHLLGAGNAPTKPKLGQLSPAAEMSRVPPNPADLLDALQDSIHQEVGKSRVAKSVRSRNK